MSSRFLRDPIILKLKEINERMNELKKEREKERKRERKKREREKGNIVQSSDDL